MHADGSPLDSCTAALCSGSSQVAEVPLASPGAKAEWCVLRQSGQMALLPIFNAK